MFSFLPKFTSITSIPQVWLNFHDSYTKPDEIMSLMRTITFSELVLSPLCWILKTVVTNNQAITRLLQISRDVITFIHQRLQITERMQFAPGCAANPVALCNVLFTLIFLTFILRPIWAAAVITLASGFCKVTFCACNENHSVLHNSWFVTMVVSSYNVLCL